MKRYKSHLENAYSTLRIINEEMAEAKEAMEKILTVLDNEDTAEEFGELEATIEAFDNLQDKIADGGGEISQAISIIQRNFQTK